MSSASGGAVLVGIGRSGSSTSLVVPLTARKDALMAAGSVSMTVLPIHNDGSSSPREVDRLRGDAHSWLARLELLSGCRAHVSFLREVRNAAETMPQPFFGFNQSPPKQMPATELERVQKQLDAMRRVEAFLEIRGRTAKSPQKCYTFAEAIESAAFEYLKRYATEIFATGNGDTESDADGDNDIAMRSASSPPLSVSSGSSAPSTPRNNFHDTAKSLNASNESALRAKPQRRSKQKNNL